MRLRLAYVQRQNISYRNINRISAGRNAVKLAEWRKKMGLTQAELAQLIGCTQPYVSQIERATQPIIPGPQLLAKIYQRSGGLVQPNDFYTLPEVGAQRAA